MIRIFLFFIGYVTAVVPTERIEALTSAVFASKIYVKLGKRRKNGRRITLSESAYSELLPVLEATETELLRIRHHGVPHIWRLYGKRYGIFIGSAVMAAMLLISDEFVWRIEVSGNENVSETEIEKALAKLGFSLGTYVDGVDFDVLHNRFLAESDDIAWISVNMHGSVAYAEVREYLPSDDGVKEGAANIVAAKDGVITQVSVKNGKREAVIGDVVKKGQLLISGVMEYEGKDTRYVYAEGEVYAVCERRILVNIPLSFDVKTKTEPKTTRYGIKFFSREIFFGGKGRIDEAVCDTITMYKDVTVFGETVLPIALVTVEHSEYEVRKEQLTPERASAIAYAEYKKAFIKETEGVTLLSYDTESGLSPDGSAYVIECVLSVIENIAETKEFTVNE